jgi:hypothetical protein
MFYRLEEMLGFAVHSSDGEIGYVEDFYFDDESWAVRYAVVDIGSWIFGRHVLISPFALGTPDMDEETLSTTLTRDQVEDSPDINCEQPVSKQELAQLHDYYGWPTYWAGGSLGITSPDPMAMAAAQPAPSEQAEVENGDPHLRSVREVTGYTIQATDGEIGHVEDFFADEDWTIRYMMIDTRDWLPGKDVLISPDWVEKVVWEASEVVVEMTQDRIEESPAFDSEGPLLREYEKELYQHYGYSEYWA